MQNKSSILLFLVLSSISSSRINAPTAEVCRRIPFYFSPSSNIPIIDIEIEGVRYPCELDLGSTVGDIVLKPEILEGIRSKKFKEIATGFDLKGNSYQTEEFLVSSVNIEGLQINNAIVSEESLEFLKNAVIFPAAEIAKSTESDSVIAGRIGIHLFKAYVCLFDFSNSSILLADKIDPIILKQWIETKLDTTHGYALISFETDLGTRTFFLDTGSDACAFRESLIDKTASLKKNMAKQSPSGRWFFRSLQMRIGNINFGEQRFVVFEFEKPFENIDGILGIDFFQKQPICLDFPNGKAYLQPPQKNFWQRIFQ